MIKLKKKTASGLSYNWRPNFRLSDTLPEVRAIRTKLFVPIMAALAASVFLIFILGQEYRAMSIQENIEKLQQEIVSHSAQHDEKVELNAEFLALTRTIDEVLAFKEGKLIGSDYLLTVSSNLLDGMYLDKVEYMDGRSTVEGSVEVPAEEASRLVNDYLKSLQEADALQGLLTEYKLTSLEREGTGDVIKFRIEISNPEEEEKKK